MPEKLTFYPEADLESIPSTESESSPVDTSRDLDTSPISIDLDAPEADEEESLLPEDYDTEALVESSRTRQHPVNSGWFKALIVLVGVAVAFGILMIWYNSARSVKLVKEEETKPVHVKKDKAKANKNSDRISNAVQTGNLKRDQAYADLKDKEKERLKKNKSESAPPRPSRPKRTSSTRTQRPALPPPSYRPPPRSRVVVPPPPRAIPVPSTPKPQPAPPTVAAKPVDRSPVFGGQLPQAESTQTGAPPASNPSAQLISNPAQSQQADNQPIQSPLLAAQQTAFLQGQTMTTIPSGSTLKAEVESESIADDSSTFTAITTEAIAGIPQGSEVTARIVQLASGGYFEAEVIGLNDSEVTPGTTRISRVNGQLLQAKGGQPKKGFFQTGLGQMIKGFAQEAGESWLQDKLGGNQAIGNLSREVIVLADRSTEGSPQPTVPEEGAILIPRGEIVITFKQDAFISR